MFTLNSLLSKHCPGPGFRSLLCVSGFWCAHFTPPLVAMLCTVFVRSGELLGWQEITA